MKRYRKLYIITIVYFVMFIYNSHYLKAQNEAYHGGIGDGSSVSQSASTNFEDVNYEGTTALTVSIDLAIGQENLTENTPFNFTVIFSEAITDFTSDDVVLSGTASPAIANVSGSGTTYNVQVSGTKSNGTVIINIPVGAGHNSFGNPNSTPTIIDNEVTYTGQDLTVEITLSIYQNTPTNNKTVNFVATFNDEVSDFTNSDISFSGTANPTNVSISGSGKIYDIAITGMSENGTVIIYIPENAATNPYGKKNSTSINTENQVVCDYISPTVTIDLADGQSNPTYSLPVRFKIVFSEDINYFSDENIAFGGSENLSLEVNGTGRIYEAVITGAITNETVSISIPAGITYDNALNPNEKSDNTNNSVTFLGTTSINTIENSILNNIFYSQGNINIDLNEFPDKNSFVQIYDINGRLILMDKITDKNSRFPVFILENVIIIRINVNNQKINRKLFIK